MREKERKSVDGHHLMETAHKRSAWEEYLIEEHRGNNDEACDDDWSHEYD